jgi:cell division control protein 45
MILEHDQWHLGYASLLRDCRGTDSWNTTDGLSSATTGRTLLLVHPDVDAMCSARILGYMLRADGVPHQLRVCTGWGRLCKILIGLGVIAASPSNDNDDDDKVVRRQDDDEDYETTTSTTTTTCDVRAVVLINMGANRNLAKLFNNSSSFAATNAAANSQDSSSSSRSNTNNNKVRCYVIDSHRPYHLANIHVGKDVVLFNDRPLDDDDIPSDGDDLSGNDDSSSSDDDDDDDEEDEEDDNGDGTKKRSSRKNAWDDDYSDEEEFESDSIKDDEENENDDSDADDESMTAAAKRAGLTTKRSRNVGVDDDNDDPSDVPLEELQDSEEEDNEDDDDEGNIRWNKRRRSSQGLNTTTTTANLTTSMDETLLDDDQLVAASSQTSSTIQKVDYRALRKQRRTRVRLHYSSGSYHASPSSWTAYALCRQLRFGDIPDLLWLACVGLTDAYLHGKLDVAGYSALSINMKQHVGRLFPNDVIDRAGRAVYAEELETTTTYQEQQALTRIGLSENGRILYQDEYKFMLLRHTSLWDSMLHSNFVSSKLRVWKSAGRQKLMELLAKMGFPLDQCRQPWAFVGPGMKRRLGERLDDCAEVRTLER